MLALHCLATDAGDVALWAEDSDKPARRPGRAPRGAAGHPFAVPADELAGLLGLSLDADPVEVRVLLPSRPSAPVASPELVRDPLAAGQTPRGQVRLVPWLVPALRLSAADAVAATSAEALGAVEVRPGAAVRYLARVLALAEDLVARGRVLPALVEEAGGQAARWRPVLAGADSARYVRLRDALPPVVRAEQRDPAVAEGRLGDEVLRGLVEALVDGVVRARVAGVRLAPRGRFAAAEVAAGGVLRGLTSVDGEVEAGAEQARRLAGQLRTWADGAAHDGPVRACFRLRPPDPDAEPDEAVWRLEFLLQAADDPSVLVPAGKVWHGDRGAVLRRWVARPQELLLTDLGKAARTFPALDAALRERHPTGLDLDTAGAHSFLSSAAALDQAGFGVLLPRWWKASSGVGLRLTTTSAGTPGTVTRTSVLGREELVDYRWDVSLGDMKLTEEELRQLAEAKVPLVRVRGRWAHVDQRRLAAGLAFLEKAGSGQMTVDEVLAVAGLPADDEAVGVPVVGVGGTGWVADLLSGEVAQALEPMDPPPGFGAVLRPYQRRGLAWLAFLDRLGLGACLADDMGLGKTVQLLALEALCRHGRSRPPTLLVCPMSLVGTWLREAERFTPGLRVHVHHGADRAAGSALAERIDGVDLVITTYTTATRDAEELAELRWDRVVLDEAQNIKNSAARQSRAVRTLPARHRVALTGTPVENRLAELWSVLDFANPGMLGPLHTFRARYAVPVERHGDEEAAGRLRRITRPFVLRRVKTDPTVISDLPDKLEMKQLCTLTAEQASLYKAVVDDMMSQVDESEGIQRKGLVLATMSKLKQVCNHPAQFLGDGSRVAGRSGKLARLEELLDQVLADGDRALCFTQFAAFGGMLVPHLAARLDTEVAFLHGGTPARQRDRMVERFQSGKGPSVMLLSLKAGGTGLTLTAANHVLHLDRWWNPAVEDQATDRAFRIGQRRAVQVRKFVCVGTLEERIDTMIEQKKALARMVVGAGESWLGDLSTAEIRELVALSSEAVGE
ncbi:DEAD/DEAH box helicase [Actinokineospora pegani]|uniref:DEAD/DEAH box helicase n=1 Tax=Actinokineospora pegani TaxID=2654637 RepID=UPI0012EAE651|nr:DEAD/DEAH box helicase [Actinokineospora pegani]